MSEENSISEQFLIAALKNGDEQAFTTIYKEYWYRMFQVAFHKLQKREIAEELVQDIFTRLWKERARLKILNLNYYLFSAIRYEVIDHIRAKGSQRDYDDYFRAYSMLEDVNTENTIAFNDLVFQINCGLEILPEKPREIFRLNQLEHWPIAKIATYFNLSEKAIQYHLTKTTKFFRTYLNEVEVCLIYYFCYF